MCRQDVQAWSPGKRWWVRESVLQCDVMCTPHGNAHLKATNVNVIVDKELCQCLATWKGVLHALQSNIPCYDTDTATGACAGTRAAGAGCAGCSSCTSYCCCWYSSRCTCKCGCCSRHHEALSPLPLYMLANRQSVPQQLIHRLTLGLIMIAAPYGSEWQRALVYDCWLFVTIHSFSIVQMYSRFQTTKTKTTNHTHMHHGRC